MYQVSGGDGKMSSGYFGNPHHLVVSSASSKPYERLLWLAGHIRQEALQMPYGIKRLMAIQRASRMAERARGMMPKSLRTRHDNDDGGLPVLEPLTQLEMATAMATDERTSKLRRISAQEQSQRFIMGDYSNGDDPKDIFAPRD